MNITIGIVAHVDAGKTTLSEQILYTAGCLRRPGSVNSGTTIMDSDEIEMRRGITVFAGLSSFEYGKNRFFLLDTPGHSDFTAETERCLRVLDYAVMIVSATEGVQAHTETLWNMLSDLHIPVVFFINKTDITGADVAHTVEEINRVFGCDVCLADNGIDSNIKEKLALTNEKLLEMHLSDNARQGDYCDAARKAVMLRQLFFAVSGCAVSGKGVKRLLDLLCDISLTEYDVKAPFGAAAYKVRHDDKGDRLVFLKILSGKLNVKDSFPVGKINEIRMYSGAKYTSCATVCAGEICAVTGLSGVKSSDTIGCCKYENKIIYDLVVYSSVKSENTSSHELLDALEIMCDEEPELNVTYNKATDDIRISVSGRLRTEILYEKLFSRFGLKCIFGTPKVEYKETVLMNTCGIGHYEPLRHYAEVHLRIEPALRGNGISFSSEVSSDVFAAEKQRLIKTHVFEKVHRGVLIGAPLTDVNIVLTAARDHEKHTEGGDFREAVYRAVRNALMYSESSILEPYYSFKISVKNDLTGRVVSDISSMFGSCDVPKTFGATTVIRGRCPVSEMYGYSERLAAFSSGRGRIVLSVDGYEPCHNAKEVIEKSGYDREHDPESTADSVFCAKGAGYLVKWYDVKSHADKNL